MLNKVLEDMNIIIATPHGRSGSILFQSLFDMHQEVIVLPNPHDWFDFTLDNINSNDFIDDFISKHLSFFSVSGGDFLSWGNSKEILLGDSCDKDVKIDINQFRKNYITLKSSVNSLNKKNVFVLIHLAFAVTLKYDVSKIKYIFIHLHAYNNNGWKFLIENFKNLYYFALIRDIRESYVGWKNILNNRGEYDNMSNLISSMYGWGNYYTNLKNMIESKKIKNDNIYFVDLNRLHISQNKAMKKISHILNIKYDDCLTISTYLGVSWAGNTYDGKKIFGFDKNKATYKWKEQLSVQEQEIINFLFFNILKAFSYEPVKKISFLRFIFDVYYKNLAILNFKKLSDNDLKILNAIKNKNDISNKLYKLMPFRLAKFFIKLNIYVKRYIEIRNIYKIAYFKTIIRNNQNFKNLVFENNKFI